MRPTPTCRGNQDSSKGILASYGDFFEGAACYIDRTGAWGIKPSYDFAQVKVAS